MQISMQHRENQWFPVVLCDLCGKEIEEGLAFWTINELLGTEIRLIHGECQPQWSKLSENRSPLIAEPIYWRWTDLRVFLLHLAKATGLPRGFYELGRSVPYPEKELE